MVEAHFGRHQFSLAWTRASSRARPRSRTRRRTRNFRACGSVARGTRPRRGRPSRRPRRAGRSARATARVDGLLHQRTSRVTGGPSAVAPRHRHPRPAEPSTEVAPFATSSRGFAKKVDSRQLRQPPSTSSTLRRSTVRRVVALLEIEDARPDQHAARQPRQPDQFRQRRDQRHRGSGAATTSRARPAHREARGPRRRGSSPARPARRARARRRSCPARPSAGSSPARAPPSWPP